MNSGLKYLGATEVPEVRMLASNELLTELVSGGLANGMLPRKKGLGIVKGSVIAVV